MTKPKKGRRRGRDNDRERRRWKVARLLARGFHPDEIAGQLEVSERTITRDAETIRARRIAASMALDESMAMQQIARYREIQRTAWEGYERSLEDEVRVEEGPAAEVNGKAKANVMKTVRKGQSGNPSYLNTIKSCEDSISEILGVLGKAGVNVGIEVGGSANYEDAQIVRVVVETREELAEFEAMSLSQLKQATVVDGQVVDAGELFGAGETAAADGETAAADGETAAADGETAGVEGETAGVEGETDAAPGANGHAGGKLNGKKNGKPNGKPKPKPKPKDTNP